MHQQAAPQHQSWCYFFSRLHTCHVSNTCPFHLVNGLNSCSRWGWECTISYLHLHYTSDTYTTSCKHDSVDNSPPRPTTHMNTSMHRYNHFFHMLSCSNHELGPSMTLYIHIHTWYDDYVMLQSIIWPYPQQYRYMSSDDRTLHSRISLRGLFLHENTHKMFQINSWTHPYIIRMMIITSGPSTIDKDHHFALLVVYTRNDRKWTVDFFICYTTDSWVFPRSSTTKSTLLSEGTVPTPPIPFMLPQFFMKR